MTFHRHLPNYCTTPVQIGYCTIGKNRYLERVQLPFNRVASLLGLMCISTIDREIAVAVDELLDQYPRYLFVYIQI